jgi:hypothetical protein
MTKSQLGTLRLLSRQLLLLRFQPQLPLFALPQTRLKFLLVQQAVAVGIDQASDAAIELDSQTRR